jgi:hypothetical protein
MAGQFDLDTMLLEMGIPLSMDPEDQSYLRSFEAKPVDFRVKAARKLLHGGDMINFSAFQEPTRMSKGLREALKAKNFQSTEVHSLIVQLDAAVYLASKNTKA